MGDPESSCDDTHCKVLFAPFCSQISSTFWGKFSQLKLDVLGLNDQPLTISGFFGSNEIPNYNPVLSVDHSSLEGNAAGTYYGTLKAHGLLINTNTSEQFKERDKNDLIASMSQQLLSCFFTEDGLTKIEENPAVLASFFVLTYADLKKYKFIYWFAFPALTNLRLSYQKTDYRLLSEEFPDLEELQSNFKKEKDIISTGFFVMDNSMKVRSLSSISENDVSSWFAFLDSSTVDKQPGWVLRNYLVYLVLKLNLRSGDVIKILCYRPSKTSIERSFIMRIKADFEDGFLKAPKFIGWERNEKGNFGPRQADLQMSLDPERLAESSVDFNLKLMKWRLFQDFNLETMHDTKCLILGSGTLGCNVARALMGWGVRHITFVDNGNVSFSNPARQSLFFFEDCLNGGKSKAAAAADNIKKIFPGVNSRHHQIMIPMPGHPLSKATFDQVKRDYDILVEEVKNCDVMFLLLDTREARWLPTVLGVKHNKIVINAALGFDSYLVMRHGTHHGESTSTPLGCYYCTDVVAPGDSTRDRTLDQQCTVTRPGVSMIAGALAVEMVAALLHHPDGLNADATQIDPLSPLGLIPHSIRGFLSSGQVVMPSFQSFDKCTACSSKILEELENRGFEFVADVLNQSSDYLERLTGLDKLKDESEIGDTIIELSDDDDDF